MREWNYHIIDAAGRSYQIDNGMVVAIGNYKPMSHTPIGWQDIQIAWERSQSKYGIARNFSLPLGFVIDGLSILSYLNWSNNFEQQVNLLINRRTLYIDTTNYYFYYKYFYKGELDFSTYEYDNDTQKAQVGIMEGGLSKLLKANGDTEYEIDVLDEYIKMDGISLHKSVKFTVPPNIPLSNRVWGRFAMPLTKVGEDGFAAGVSVQDQIIESYADQQDYLAQSENWHLSVNDFFTSPVEFRYHGTIKFKCTKELPTGASLQLDIMRSTYLTDGNGNGFLTGTGVTPPSPGFFASRLDVTPSGNFTQDTIYTWSFDATGTLNPGEKSFLLGQLFTTVTGSIEIEVTSLEGSEIYVEYSTRQATTYPKCISLLNLYKRLGAKISGSEDDWTSEVLAARGDIKVTSGNALRRVANPTIKTTMNKLFNSVNVLLNLGMGIEGNKVVIEKKEHFFQTNNPIDLGEVKQYKDRWATDYIYNELKIGYPDVALENVNGRYAFNTSYTYTSPVKRVAKRLELTSDYKADPFEIELVRINYDGKDTTDSDKDNDNYFVQVATTTETFDGGNAYPLLRNSTITGVPDPATTFNAGITPASLVKVHKNWLAGVFNGFESGYLEFQTTQYNHDIVVDGVDQDAKVAISSLGAPLFKPVNFEFLTTFSSRANASMSLLTAYNENVEWLATGSAGVDFNNTSAPYTGTKSIFIPAATTLATFIKLSAPEPILTTSFTGLSFYLRLEGYMPISGNISVALYTGNTLIKTRHLNASQFNISLIGSYQKISVNESEFIESVASDYFDNVRISFAGFGKPAMYVDMIQMTVTPQDNLVDIMEQNPNRCFRFIHPNGKTFTGHSLKVAVAPNTEEEQGFLLLATGDTNLNDLIVS